ncbi:acyltransferase [Granulicella sp. dw_53]|uniref:acyltransferase family protein n=1 Tax=Granulicella sp. dw_53 TaxID=2719792 RepID=UPI001BD64777|nr:acyltransferase [Granulicella sp. dw_53]
MRRILELDGIRAFAIMAVIGCHYFPLSTMFFSIPEFGWAGVELFFVLSGFLITSILLQLKNRPHPYKVFYIRRILRIFPPYYAVVLLVLVVALFQHDSTEWMRYIGRALFLQSFSDSFNVLHNIWQALTGVHPIPNPFVSVILPKASNGFHAYGITSSLGPTWSLSVEEWFYVLWAPLVLHFRRRTLGFICIGVIVAALFIRWFGFIGIRGYFDFFSRIDVLLGGALLALWVEKRRVLSQRVQRRVDSCLSAATIIAGILLFWILYSIHPILGREVRDSVKFSVFGMPLIALCFAGLLSFVILHAGSDHPLSRFLRLKPFVSIGTISYTLYLVHVPIYVLIDQVGMRMGFATHSYSPALVVSLISLSLSLCIAYLSFKFYETPILNFKDKLTERYTSQSLSTHPRKSRTSWSWFGVWQRFRTKWAI